MLWLLSSSRCLCTHAMVILVCSLLCYCSSPIPAHTAECAVVQTQLIVSVRRVFKTKGYQLCFLTMVLHLTNFMYCCCCLSLLCCCCYFCSSIAACCCAVTAACVCPVLSLPAFALLRAVLIRFVMQWGPTSTPMLVWVVGLLTEAEFVTFTISAGIANLIVFTPLCVLGLLADNLGDAFSHGDGISIAILCFSK